MDFILRKKGVVIALEVKSNYESENKGLQSFREKFNPSAALVVGENGIPFKEFLSTDLSKLF